VKSEKGGGTSVTDVRGEAMGGAGAYSLWPIARTKSGLRYSHCLCHKPLAISSSLQGEIRMQPFRRGRRTKSGSVWYDQRADS
jgi:hypothetical protein